VIFTDDLGNGVYGVDLGSEITAGMPSDEVIVWAVNDGEEVESGLYLGVYYRLCQRPSDAMSWDCVVKPYESDCTPGRESWLNVRLNGMVTGKTEPVVTPWFRVGHNSVFSVPDIPPGGARALAMRLYPPLATHIRHLHDVMLFLKGLRGLDSPPASD